MKQFVDQSSKIMKTLPPESPKILEIKVTLKALSDYTTRLKKLPRESVFDCNNAPSNPFTIVTGKAFGVANVSQHFNLSAEAGYADSVITKYRKELYEVFHNPSKVFIDSTEVSLEEYLVEITVQKVRLIKILSELQLDRIKQMQKIYKEKRNEA